MESTTSQPLQFSLEDREIKIGKLMSEGRSSKEIASMLYMSDSLVRTIQFVLRKKFNAVNSPHLVTLLIKHKIINVWD